MATEVDNLTDDTPLWPIGIGRKSPRSNQVDFLHSP